ncbi:MAG: DHH family phosphoesterase [Bacteroidales bacterium]|nr:DHH family phosphoesterase [Bacteroidales bacterium]
MKDITPDNIETFARLIEEARHPVIVTHAKPDGDAIGSSVAMFHFLGLCGKDDRLLVLNDNCPRFLGFIRETVPQEALIIREEKQQKALEAIEKADLIICLDFHAFHRTGGLEMPLAESKAKKILIDHHLDPDRSLYNLSFSKNDISSASEFVFWILMATPQINGNAQNLPLACATALMTGMTTDTNNFGNSVYPSTLAMASDLLSAGVDRDMILQKINQEHSESRLRLKGFMLKDLMKVTKDGVAYMVLDKKAQYGYKMQEGDTEGFVNEPLSIGKVRMSIFAREDSGEVRISIRSKRGTSANKCAKLFFNGGGHENAAGGKLFMPISEVEEYIKKHAHIYMTEYEK